MGQKEKLLWYFDRKLINYWPPYLFAGIQMVEKSDDYSYIKVKLSLNRWNKNFFGTQFGGSMFSMTDPWYTLMISYILGPDYYVWDKSASIKFIAPGEGDVFAEFKLSKEQIEDIKEKANSNKKYEPEYTVQIVDANKKLICEVKKIIYIKKKKKPSL